MRWVSRLAVLGLVGVFAAGALADAPMARPLVQATVGGTVTVTASGADPGSYRLSIADTRPAHGVICSAKVVSSVRAVKGRLKATGKVPAGLICYGDGDVVLSHVKLSAGTYRLFLCQPDGPTSCDASHTVIEHQVIVKLPLHNPTSPSSR